ncbi:neutral zinc metallopeptidase [Leifsonia sp. PS1209]|uniref:KPN_02809 family neutral zinc metallopeptidase n=1 Tax=Leifsonia sp. PS1209 TaxID=2724914 RepID=UPI001442CC36|nr:neutral zinc metallopeptidase [Leifsonia sp. PS1209]QIZ99966.1 neutral zinc metallopeptidase [Leifsonia sp. PS1209]
MTFNPNADISGGKTKRRGRTAGIAAGGVGLGAIAILLLSQLLGVDLTGFVDGGASQGQTQQIGTGEELTDCTTGADANARIDCRMKGAAASIEAFWTTEMPALGGSYTSPQFVLFTGQTGTGCGAASSATGPFYCPTDQTVYVDTAFYDELRTRFGSSGGPLAEMYVVAHEWGHHIQNIGGIMDVHPSRSSGAASDSVRLELQADCFAGAWVGAASTTKDENGVPFLQPITEAQIQDALSAASAVGDDRIQRASTGDIQPDTWTHGSSEQRQRWFSTGFQNGAASCDTFSVRAGSL